MLRRHLSQHFNSVSVIAIIILATVAACSSSSQSTAAHDLDVLLYVTSAPQPNMLALSAKFQYQSENVQFKHAERFLCDGVPLHFATNDFEAFVPDITEGHAMSCSYTDARGIETTINFTLPAKPVILSPKPEARVVRSKTFPITYVPASVDQVQINVDPINESATPPGTTCLDQQKSGSTTCDVSSLPRGPARIQIVFSSKSTLPNTGFHSVELSFDRSSNINVTWI
jgi:hypothetical protein